MAAMTWQEAFDLGVWGWRNRAFARNPFEWNTLLWTSWNEGRTFERQRQSGKFVADAKQPDKTVERLGQFHFCNTDN